MAKEPTRHPATLTTDATPPKPDEYKPDTTAKAEGYDQSAPPTRQYPAGTQPPGQHEHGSPAAILWGRLQRELMEAGRLVNTYDTGPGSFTWFEKIYTEHFKQAKK